MGAVRPVRAGSALDATVYARLAPVVAGGTGGMGAVIVVPHVTVTLKSTTVVSAVGFSIGMAGQAARCGVLLAGEAPIDAGLAAVGPVLQHIATIALALIVSCVVDAVEPRLACVTRVSIRASHAQPVAWAASPP